MIAEFNGVSKSFGKKKIITDMSFSIDSGEIIGLLGPNGSGKTTIMKLLSGLIYPDSGFIENSCYFRSLIETPCFYKTLSGYDNLLYFAAIGNIEEKSVDKTVELLGIENYIHKKVSQYSLGMKQKLGIACTLIGKPDLLIMDEPINGLDPLIVVEMRELLKKINGELGTTILISSHILQEMQEICNRVLLIKEGKIIGNVAVGQDESSYVLSFYCESDCVAALNLLGNHAQKSFSPYELVVSDYQPIYSIISYLVNNNLKLTEIRKKNTDLEEIYCEFFKG